MIFRIELGPEYRTSDERKDLEELASALGAYGQVTPSHQRRLREVEAGAGDSLTLIAITVTFGASALKQVYRILSAYLGRHKGRQVTIQDGDKMLTIRGHGPVEEKVMLEKFSTASPKKLAAVKNKKPRGAKAK